jgi:hypothetical protein
MATAKKKALTKKSDSDKNERGRNLNLAESKALAKGKIEPGYSKPPGETITEGQQVGDKYYMNQRMIAPYGFGDTESAKKMRRDKFEKKMKEKQNKKNAVKGNK